MSFYIILISFNWILFTCLISIITQYFYVILDLLCKFSFFYFYSKIIKNPTINYISESLEVLNIFNIIFLLIIFITFTYLGLKFFNLLKNFILYVNKSFKNTTMQSNPGPILGLLFLSTNTSVSSKFFAKREYVLEGEIKSLTLVLLKLDREQPHPSGINRLAAFGEYLHDLDKQRRLAQYWANHHYYRDVVMAELRRKFSDNVSEAGSVSDTSFSDTSSIFSIVTQLG